VIDDLAAQHQEQPCCAALAAAFMEVFESAARHLPVDKALYDQAFFINTLSQCDGMWGTAVVMIQDSSQPPEHLIHAQQVVTAANLCISAVLRLVGLPIRLVQGLAETETGMWTCRIEILQLWVGRESGIGVGGGRLLLKP
jgi:hypothetical protein